jgi:hypothetical protein
MYYYCEYDEVGTPKCDMHLHINEHPPNEECKLRYILAQGIELWDTCQKAARRALTKYCKEYKISIDGTHAKYCPVKDQTSIVWRKKI